MRLVDSVPWQAEALDTPPVKLDYGEIEIPSDLDVTYIGILHHMIGGAPDYMREALEEADVLAQETPGWSKQFARRIQGVADGSYSALKQSLEQVEKQRQYNPALAEWNEYYFHQLYESGVRVILPDYPERHPKVDDERKLLQGGFASLSQDAICHVFADRDKYILNSMVDKVNELRRMVPDIRSKSPLRVLMLFGASHYAVHDALAAAAEEQGVVPFNSRLLFQESADMMADMMLDAFSPEHLADARRRATDYQNWLRTPED